MSYYVNGHNNGIYLQNNNITSIPASFGNLDVETLDISNNHITTVSTYFGNSNIKDLNISYNRIG